LFFIENVLAKSNVSSVNQQTNVKAVEKALFNWCVCVSHWNCQSLTSYNFWTRSWKRCIYCS